MMHLLYTTTNAHRVFHIKSNIMGVPYAYMATFALVIIIFCSNTPLAVKLWDVIMSVGRITIVMHRRLRFAPQPSKIRGKPSNVHRKR